MGIVGALFATLWFQDVTARQTPISEGAGAAITFDADAATYRLLASGTNRPDSEWTSCEITQSDGSIELLLSGEGPGVFKDGPTVARVLEFEAPAGPTTMRSKNNFSPPGSYGGQIHVVEASGLLSPTLSVAGVFLACLFALRTGWIMLARRRSRDATPAGSTTEWVP